MLRKPGTSRPSVPMQPTIPEDEAIIITPTSIPQRPFLHTSDSWKHPCTTAWSSQAATAPASYDINPKYTTANQSYTHRRRKKSMITKFIWGRRDPYQPQYRDWRASMDSPQSPWACDERRSPGRRGKVAGMCGGLLLLILSVVVSAMLVFGGPEPLVSVTAVNPFGGTFAGDVWGRTVERFGNGTWRSGVDCRLSEMEQQSLRRWQLKERYLTVKEWFAGALRYGDSGGDGEEDWDGKEATVKTTSELISTNTAAINSALLGFFGAETMATSAKPGRTELTRVMDEDTSELQDFGVTVVSRSVQVGWFESGRVRDVAPVPTPSDAEDDKGGEADDETGLEGQHQSRVAKSDSEHYYAARTVGAGLSRSKKVETVVGTLGEGVSPPTET